VTFAKCRPRGGGDPVSFLPRRTLTFLTPEGSGQFGSAICGAGIIACTCWTAAEVAGGRPAPQFHEKSRHAWVRDRTGKQDQPYSTVILRSKATKDLLFDADDLDASKSRSFAPLRMTGE